MNIPDYYKHNDEFIEIPDELDSLVKGTIKEHNMKKRIRKITKWSSGLAVLSAFIILVNVSPTFADSFSDIPILGHIVKVTTFTHYEEKSENYDMNIDVPNIEIDNSLGKYESDESDSIKSDIGNKKTNEELNQVISELNDKYIVEGKALYEEFQKDTQELDLNGGGHMGVDSGYEIKTNDDKFLSIGRYILNTAGSSSTVINYDTIDKENAVLVTLPSLFKDDSYISILSNLIIEQMKTNMANDDYLVYWIGDSEIEAFTSISAEQKFYINADHQLVISFDKYDVSPGYMGLPEFVIPTDKIADILVDPDYLR